MNHCFCLLPRLALPLVLALATAAVYSQVLTFEFIKFDDNIYISDNPHLAAGLTWDAFVWAFTTSQGGHWHPITWLSHLLDVSLFGMSAGWHHLVSVLIHSANTALVFSLLRVASLDVRVAAISALIFSLHPLRLESVAWVAERKDVLSMFFALSSAIYYVRFVLSRAPVSYLMGLLLFALALLAKPTVAPLPVLLILLDLWPCQRFALQEWLPPLSWAVRRSLLEKIPFLLLAVCFSLVTVYAQWKGGGLRDLGEVPLGARLGGIAPGILAYLGKLFWPSGLAIFYPRITYPPGVAAGAMIGLIAVSWVCLQQRRRAPYLLVAWLWMMVALLPVSGVVAVGGQAFADRWTYLPHLLPIVALVYGSLRLGNSELSRQFIVGSWLAVVALLAGVTLKTLPVWRSSQSVFTHALAVSPENFLAHTNLGAALLAKGDSAAAGHHFEEAVRLNPTYPEALNNLGIYRASEGRLTEAISAFNRALAIRPGFTVAEANLALAREELANLRARMEP